MNTRTAMLDSFYDVNIRSLDTVESEQCSRIGDVVCFRKGCIQTERAEEVRGWSEHRHLHSQVLWRRGIGNHTLFVTIQKSESASDAMI